MAESGLVYNAQVNLDLRRAESQWKRFERSTNTRTMSNGLGRISANVKDFDKSLGAATNRVVAFAAAATVFTTLQRATSALVKSIVEVDQSLTKINVNLGQSASNLKKFGSELFTIARSTGQTFKVAADAAEELARQGLGAQETLKRVKDALILSRIAGIDSASAVDTLTAAINTFNKEALTSTEIINKFAAVDTKFAVSSNDLAQAVSRVGSTAAAAGVGLDELVSLVTSLQQTTARGGAVIGNGLKTIFTRITAAPETVNALQNLGIAITDTSGNLRSAIDILKDYAQARLSVGEAERQSLDRTIAGTFQINILKAAIADLSRGYSVYDKALKTSSNATDEAIRKNEQLNTSLTSLINETSVSVKQFFSALGDIKISGFFGEILQNFSNLRKFLSGETGNELGEALGNSILKGVANVVSGPVLVGLTTVIARSLSKVFATIGGDIRGLIGLNQLAEARAKTQERINFLVSNANGLEQAQLNSARSLLQTKQALLNIEKRINQEALVGTPLVNSLLSRNAIGVPKSGLRKVPGFADPLSSAINKEMQVSGLPKSQIYVDRDARVANFANPLGLLVANRRDEPLGGFQGVNRVIAQGGNPQKGSIPGFAAPLTRQDFISRGQFIKQSTLDDLNRLFESLRGLDRIRIRPIAADIRELTQSLNQSSRNLVTGKILSEQARARRSEGKIIQSGTYFSPFVSPPASSNANINSGILNRFRPQATTQYGSPIGPGFGGTFTQEDRLLRQQAAQRLINLRRERIQNNIQEQRALRSQRLNKVSFGAAFALPFAAGLLPEGQGGTLGGVGLGAAQGALQGAGIGGIFGPAGLAIGGILGGLQGAFGKLTKSVEEFNAELDNGIQKQKDAQEALIRIFDIESQIGETSDPRVRERLIRQRLGIEGQIQDPEIKARLQQGFGSNEERQKFLESVSDRVALNQSRVDFSKTLNEQNQGNIFQRVGGVLRGGSFGIQKNFGIEANFASKIFDNTVILPLKLFGKQLEDTGRSVEELFFSVKESDGEFKQLISTLKGGLTKENISGINAQQLIGISGQDFSPENLQIVNDALKALGSSAEATEKNFQEVALAIVKAIQSFTQGEKEIKKETESRNRKPVLSKNAFLSGLDTNTIGNAARLSSSRFGIPQVSRGQKGVADFAFYEALISANPGFATSLESNPAYKQSRALTQKQNALKLGFDFLSGAGIITPSTSGQYYNEKNGFFGENILRALSGITGGNQNKASIISNFIKQAQNTVDVASGTNRSYVPLPKSDERNVIQRGTFSEEYNTQRKQEAEKYFGIVKEMQNTLKDSVITTKIEVDGVVKIVSEGFNNISKENINQGVLELVMKEIQKQGSRISALEGKPQPPSLVNTR